MTHTSAADDNCTSAHSAHSSVQTTPWGS